MQTGKLQFIIQIRNLYICSMHFEIMFFVLSHSFFTTTPRGFPIDFDEKLKVVRINLRIWFKLYFFFFLGHDRVRLDQSRRYRGWNGWSYFNKPRTISLPETATCEMHFTQISNV